MGILVPKPMLGRQLRKGHRSARGLAGYWLLNEGSGNIVSDLSGNGLDGVFQGTAPSWTPGKFGSAVNLPGTDEYIKIPDFGNTLSGLTGFTCIWWWKITTLGVQNAISQWVEPRQLLIREDGTGFDAFLWTDAQYGGDFGDLTLTANVWQQLAVTWDGATIRGYLNAKESTSNYAMTGSIQNSTQDLFIGKYVANYTDGAFDHVMFFNRALSASEIAELYLRPFAMFDRMPIELWVGATSVGVPPVGIQTYMHHYQQAS